MCPTIQQCRLRDEFTTEIQGKGYVKKRGYLARHFTKSLVVLLWASFREKNPVTFSPFRESYRRADLFLTDNCGTVKMYLAQSQNVFMDYKDCKSKGRKNTCSTPYIGLLLTNHWGGGRGGGRLYSCLPQTQTNPEIFSQKYCMKTKLQKAILTSNSSEAINTWPSPSKSRVWAVPLNFIFMALALVTPVLTAYQLRLSAHLPTTAASAQRHHVKHCISTLSQCFSDYLLSERVQKSYWYWSGCRSPAS